MLDRDNTRLMRSNFRETLDRMAERTAAAVVARAHTASPGLNRTLLRRLSVQPGHPDALLSDPVFETARDWLAAPKSLGDLAGNLLSEDVVAALDRAGPERMPRSRFPYMHQYQAWQAASEGKSCLVTSGTGSGKTECFMVPMLDDLTRNRHTGGGVRAIVIYPLNALIESQRDRLAAWAEGLGGRVRFAMYNGLTPRTKREIATKLSSAEVGDRRSIREKPPEILVTNVTMLEYMLLRAEDQTILANSQGLLRWIVLDEAHSYVGAQAAEMTLLLRRVRAAFGVSPQDVRLMATSATIGGEADASAKLRAFVADLAGTTPDRACVIEGQSVEPVLPAAVNDSPLDPSLLQSADPAGLWQALAPHPRLQSLRIAMNNGAVKLETAAHHLCSDATARDQAQTLLDLAAQAVGPAGQALLRWRAHVFMRAQGGIWACVDPACSYRDDELVAEDSGWPFGAIALGPRDHCACGCPMFEVVTCNSCGQPHLATGMTSGVVSRLVPAPPMTVDDFAVDLEPEDDEPEEQTAQAWLAALGPVASLNDHWITLPGAAIAENAAPEDSRTARYRLYTNAGARSCCLAAANARLVPLRFGPAYFMGNTLPVVLEGLCIPMDTEGLPMAGRRAISFTDSRQGVARLAAKLQRDAELNLTRAFLLHSVQAAGQGGASLDAQRASLEEQRAKLQAKLVRFRKHPEDFAEDITETEQALANLAQPKLTRVAFAKLVADFSVHPELEHFATRVWQGRDPSAASDMSTHPEKLAEMFVMRELFRRPKVQNNAETMGLVRLCFPDLEEAARHGAVPAALAEKGLDKDAWIGLLQAGIDLVFRSNFAVRLPGFWMRRWVSPRTRGEGKICRADLQIHERPEGANPWPAATSQSRLPEILYTLLGGTADNPQYQDSVAEILDHMWRLIRDKAATSVGPDSYQLDYTKAALERVDQPWRCPVTRTLYAWSIGGRSPQDITRQMQRLDFPRLPEAKPFGMTEVARVRQLAWCQSDPTISALRREGIWTNLHDRIATFAPFLRAQEHSAQLQRFELKDYEDQFKLGQINLLNCSTTMEMGVDIPNVQVVVNANVPPSVSNYRQRVGRAGRRGEHWAFGITFCRDLPLDQRVFRDPSGFLAAPIAAPLVRLDSPELVSRHVNALILSAFLRQAPDGFKLNASIGAFFGASVDAEDGMTEGTQADVFIARLANEEIDKKDFEHLERLVSGTCLQSWPPEQLITATRRKFEDILARWRSEFRVLVEMKAVAIEPEVKKFYELQAKRMAGQFLLGGLGQRGFTPVYGFPTDVVSFSNISTLGSKGSDYVNIRFDETRGATSRTLDVAIREYAPGAEIVVDGLVHVSEGIQPAWSAQADVSGLEDLKTFWICQPCGAFGQSHNQLEACPQCASTKLTQVRTLRPSGFLSRSAPHTGYENLAHVPFEMPLISAQGADWLAFPQVEAGRMRSQSGGQVFTVGSGPFGRGYALCLSCGRAVPEAPQDDGFTTGPIPRSIMRHYPLAPSRKSQMTDQGYCRGGHGDPARIQRNLRLIHVANTDVFELQTPVGADRNAALALGAALREALTGHLGLEARELGVSVGPSRGPSNEARVSTFLNDRAAGGAGFAIRLAEPQLFGALLADAVTRLTCPDECQDGCPACVLRPDLNFGQEKLDRPGGLLLATRLHALQALPKEDMVFGEASAPLGTRAADWTSRLQRQGRLSSLTLTLHGHPKDWAFSEWPGLRLLSEARLSGIPTTVIVPNSALVEKELDAASLMALIRIGAVAQIVTQPTPPVLGRAPLLAVLNNEVGIASLVPEEALPDALWGFGDVRPLITGPVLPLAFGPALDVPALLGVLFRRGDVLLTLKNANMAGPTGGFGTRFWESVAEFAPGAHRALAETGIKRLTYSDRYLATPMNLRLLINLLLATPGRKGATFRLVTAAIDTRDRPHPTRAYHNFETEAQRQETIRIIFNKADLSFREKSDVPHFRLLHIELRDGRAIKIFMDQGLGAFRLQEPPSGTWNSGPHPASVDFGQPARKIAERILALTGSVEVIEQAGSPIFVCMESDNNSFNF